MTAWILACMQCKYSFSLWDLHIIYLITHVWILIYFLCLKQVGWVLSRSDPAPFLYIRYNAFTGLGLTTLFSLRWKKVRLASVSHLPRGDKWSPPFWPLSYVKERNDLHFWYTVHQGLLWRHINQKLIIPNYNA